MTEDLTKGRNRLNKGVKRGKKILGPLLRGTHLICESSAMYDKKLWDGLPTSGIGFRSTSRRKTAKKDTWKNRYGGEVSSKTFPLRGRLNSRDKGKIALAIQRRICIARSNHDR